MKAFKITAFIILGLIVLVMLGPRMAEPVLNKELPVIGGSVEQYVTRIEAAEKVRPGNEAKIVWANDSLKTPTEYVFLYLHGFSASRREGYPVNENVPKLLGANAYLARLASHGLVTDNPLIDMSPDRLYESAKQALIIASQLGQKVVVIGTSTGGTLALMLAADFPDKVNSLVLYSPNIQIKQKSAQFLSMPWGLQIARLNFGGDFRVTDDDPNGEICKYWYCRYRAEGPVYLQQLVASRGRGEIGGNATVPLWLRQLRAQSLEPRQLAALQQQGGAFGRQFPGQRGADAAAGASQQDGLAGEFHWRGSVSSRSMSPYSR